MMAAIIEDANITVKIMLTVTEFDYKDQLKRLKDEDARIIIASFSKVMARKIFCEVYNIGLYGKEYVWILNGGDQDKWWLNSRDTNCTSWQIDRATRGIITAYSHTDFVATTTDEFELPKDLRRQMTNSGHEFTKYVPQTYDALWTIAHTLRIARQKWLEQGGRIRLEDFTYYRRDMANEFFNIIKDLKFVGVSGPISFDGPDRQGITEFHQKQDEQVMFALYHPDKEYLNFHCNECRSIDWQGKEVPIARRIFKHRISTINFLAFFTVSILCLLGIVVAVIFLIFNLYFRKLKYIKLSSPRLNNIVVVGCILVYAAVILLGVDHATLPSNDYFSIACTVRAYLLSSGFTLAFGSMFTKTYRVHKLFTRSCTGIVRNKMLKDKQLMAMVGFLLLIDCFLVTLWMSVDPINRRLWNLTIEISKTERNVAYMEQVEYCSSVHMDKWLGALYVYKGLLLVFGCYMAWETRNVKFQALNDSRYIGLSVYNVVITSVIVVFIANIVTREVTLSFMLVSSLILVSTTTALCLLFLPKMHAIYKRQDDDPVVAGMGLKIECNTRRFDIDETKELYYRAEVQNRAYKRELAELDHERLRITRLINELDSPTEDRPPSSLRHIKADISPVNDALLSRETIPSVFQQHRNSDNLQNLDYERRSPSFNYSTSSAVASPYHRTTSKNPPPPPPQNLIEITSTCDNQAQEDRWRNDVGLGDNATTSSLSVRNDTVDNDRCINGDDNLHFCCCDDDWDIDNFTVFQEVIIGDLKPDSENTGSFIADHCSEIDRTMPKINETAGGNGADASSSSTTTSTDHATANKDVSVMHKKYRVEKLRRELKKIELELKAMEQNSVKANV